MSRRGRRNGFDLEDVGLILSKRVASVFAIVMGLAGMSVYYLTEPPLASPDQPLLSLGHIFWEAIAIRAFWPFAGLFALGVLGFVVTSFKSDPF